VQRSRQKKNPLRNLGARVKLNPFALALRRSEMLSQARSKRAKEALLESKRKGIAPKQSPIAINVAKKANLAEKKHAKNRLKNYNNIAGVGFTLPKPTSAFLATEEAPQQAKPLAPKKTAPEVAKSPAGPKAEVAKSPAGPKAEAKPSKDTKPTKPAKEDKAPKEVTKSPAGPKAEAKPAKDAKPSKDAKPTDKPEKGKK